MFENLTYEYLLKRALSNVPSDVDKRQGSVIYDALAPVCAELAQAYIQMEIIMQEVFADTASREYLILRAKEIGLAPHEATKAVLKMEATYSGADENVNIGDRFSLNGLNYVVIEQIAGENDNAVFGQWKVECETEGIIGNTQFGELLPLQTVKDLVKATLTEVLIPGEDIEDTEVFRQRYFDTVNNDAFGGNRADYKKWLNEFDGVGMVKFVRTPESGGTVGVIITDSENNVPSDELLNKVKEELDPVGYEGLGAGIAPVGHVVDVKGVDGVQLSISVKWQLLEGTNEDTVYIKGAEIMKKYLSEINEKWEDTKSLTVNAFQLMAKQLILEGSGHQTVIYANGLNNQPVFKLGTDDVEKPTSNITIKDIYISHRDTGYDSARNLIEAGNINGLYIYRVGFNFNITNKVMSGSSIIKGSGYMRNVHIHDCVINSNIPDNSKERYCFNFKGIDASKKVEFCAYISNTSYLNNTEFSVNLLDADMKNKIALTGILGGYKLYVNKQEVAQ